MRILHTSDWHLGQNFMGKSREPEHRAFIDWLLDTVVSEKVDAVIIAGDLFDTGTPPSYARKLYHEFIVTLKQRSHCQLIIVGGNHDSVATLEESRQLLALLNVTVVGGVADTPEEQLVTLNNQAGQAGGVLCAIPFIRPRDVVSGQAGESQQDKQRALQAGIRAHYSAVYAAACDLRDQLSDATPLPIIATGHLTTVGSSSSESVRDIYIGTLEAFPTDCLPAADYIALGHLHKPQQVADKEHIRYSGSPIPLSFDEAATEKQVVLVDFAKGMPPRVTPLPIPRSQPLQALRGSLIELQSAIDELDDPAAGKTLWLEAEVHDDDYLTDLAQRIQAMLEGRPIELLRTRRARNKLQERIERHQQETLAELSVEEVFERRLQQVTLDENSARRVQLAFAEVVHALQNDHPNDAPSTRQKAGK
jgi:exonuclease SbcD